MKEKKDRNEAIIGWCKLGVSYSTIGFFFKISKQRVHQIYRKKKKLGFWRRLKRWLKF